MFYTEEDIQPAVTAAERVFGKTGTMIHNARLLNVALATRKYGKIWSGDIDMSPNDFALKCSGLAKTIGEKLFLLEDGNYDFTARTTVFSN